MLESHGVWWGGLSTFFRPRSLDLSQEVDAMLTWGGVGMLTFLRPRSLDLAQDADAMGLGGGGVGGGGGRDGNACSTLRRTLMLRPR